MKSDNKGERPAISSNQAVIIPSEISKLIEEILQYKVYSEAEIARKVGVNKYTIMRLRQAKMQDNLGRITSRLIALYCKLFYGQ